MTVFLTNQSLHEMLFLKYITKADKLDFQRSAVKL